MTTFEITFVHGDQKTKVEVKSEDKGDALNTAIHQVYGEKAYFAESNGTGGKYENSVKYSAEHTARALLVQTRASLAICISIFTRCK